MAFFTLALGIGANAAIFSVADAAMFKPLPYKNAARLVDVISEIRHPNGDETGMVGVSGPRVAELRAMRPIFDAVEAYGGPRPMALAGGPAETLRIGSFAPALPSLLGVTAELGRTLTADDVAAGTAMVISDAYWKRAFGGEASVIGRTLVLAGRSGVIVGVMPPTFRFFAGMTTDGWLPLDERKGGDIVARLRPGLTFDQAQRDLNAVVSGGAGLTPESWETGQSWRLQLRHADWMRSDPATRTMLGSLVGAVALVLLVACANVGNLLLSRTLARQREIAVRASLGATSWLLVRQFMVEGLVPAGLGGAGGLTLAWWAIRAVPALVPARLTYSLFGAYLPQLDARVLTFAVGAAILTGVLCGLAPAARASRSNIAGLGGGQRVAGVSRGQRRVLAAFQTAQVALTLVLLLGAGLLAASFVRMVTAPDGFDANGLAYAYVMLPSKMYTNAPQRFAFFDQLATAVRNLPDVRAAVLGPSPNSSLSGRFSIEGHDMPPGSRPTLDIFFVGPDYFRAAGIPLVSGRTFGPADGPSSPMVAVISANAAERFWPGQSPIGQRFRMGPAGSPLTIVGVAGHVKTIHFTENGIEAYVPLGQDGSAPNCLLVRFSGNPAPILSAIGAEVRAIDPTARVSRAGLVDDIFAETDPMGPPRFYAGLMGLFAGLGLLTAAIGLYGVLSYAVGRRRQEIGVRVALGAGVARLRWLVFADAMVPVVAGVTIGLVASTWLSRFIASELYQVKPHDPLTSTAIVALLVVVCALAAAAPARAATRVDPLEALRTD